MKCRPPQFRRLASDLKDRLRASLNAANGGGVLQLSILHATSTAAVGSLQRADSAHPLNSYFDKLSNVRRATIFICLRPKTKPAQNFQMRGKRNFQMRRKFCLEQGRFHNKISALALAGAGGIEPLKKGPWHKGFFNRNPRFDSIFDSFLPPTRRIMVGRPCSDRQWLIPISGRCGRSFLQMKTCGQLVSSCLRQVNFPC
jgi:hypothetical protein